MSARDAAWAVLGWQIAVAVRFAADLLFDWHDRRKLRKRREARATAEPTTTQ
jgi:hypothetical protein